MHLTPEIRESLRRSVLCWLATVDADGQPNVSPKEIFAAYSTDTVLVANIASPQTARNLAQQARACLSVLDIFVQKGWQLKGMARLLRRGEDGYAEREAVLQPLAGGLFPFDSLFEFRVETAKPILAPRYRLYPETTEAAQIARARQAYGCGEPLDITP